MTRRKSTAFLANVTRLSPPPVFRGESLGPRLGGTMDDPGCPIWPMGQRDWMDDLDKAGVAGVYSWITHGVP